MKPRHAAVLALAGWYLMVPPTLAGKSHPDDSAPLGSWVTGAATDTADECFSAKLWIANKITDATAPDIRYRADHSQCIASDDPRPKEK